MGQEDPRATWDQRGLRDPLDTRTLQDPRGSWVPWGPHGRLDSSGAVGPAKPHKLVVCVELSTNCVKPRTPTLGGLLGFIFFETGVVDAF